MSPANNLVMLESRSAVSLTSVRKRSGPRTESVGNPANRDFSEDIDELTKAFAFCLINNRKSLIANGHSIHGGVTKTISLRAISELTLRKHAYSNILKTLQPKRGNFPIKNSDIFHISAQNIDCGYPLEPPRRGGSNKYPQSMFLSRNKKNNVYPCKPQVYYIKVGLKGVKII